MKFDLQATPAELREHGRKLVGVIEKTLAPHDPVLADSLAKALTPQHAPKMELRSPALRDLHELAAQRYTRAMSSASLEIMEILAEAAPKRASKQSALIDELAGSK